MIKGIIASLQKAFWDLQRKKLARYDVVRLHLKSIKARQAHPDYRLKRFTKKVAPMISRLTSLDSPKAREEVEELKNMAAEVLRVISIDAVHNRQPVIEPGPWWQCSRVELNPLMEDAPDLETAVAANELALKFASNFDLIRQLHEERSILLRRSLAGAAMIERKMK